MKNDLKNVLKTFDGKTVAISKTGRTFEYRVRVYKDFSISLDCYEDGQYNCTWCSVRILKEHLTYLRSVRCNTLEEFLNSDKQSLIPKEWDVIEPDFFKALDIA